MSPFAQATGCLRRLTVAFGKSRHGSGRRKLVARGRVEMWRGFCRSDISVSAPFVWRCLSGSTVAPFPHPAHRTGRADFPHPALGQDLTPLFGVRRLLQFLNPSWSLYVAQSPRFFTTYCVCLELRPLPSAGITRFQRYYEPLRHPKAPGLSLAGFQWSLL